MASSQAQANELWPLFPVFFIGVWLFVSLTISRMGWSSFAERYPAQTRPRGMAYRSPSTSFGSFARYGNVVHVIFTDAGVYFYASVLFRPFHSPFLVPWESVKRVEKKRVLFWPRYRIDIQDSSGEIHVILPVSVENALLLHERLA